MNHYEVLGVEPSALQQDIEKAFRRKARELHPDRHALLGAEQIKHANKAMAQVNEAFRILRNPLDRQLYDARLAHKARHPIRSISSIDFRSEPAMLFGGLVVVSVFVPFMQAIINAGSLAITLWVLVFIAAIVAAGALWVLLSKN